MVDCFSVIPGVYVVLRKSEPRDEVLLQLRQNTGYMDGLWSLAAAGHIESGESVFTAGCREANEELGVHLDESDLRSLTTVHRTYGSQYPHQQRVDFYVECRVWNGDLQRSERDLASDLRWFPLAGLPENLVPHEQEVLNRIKQDDLPPIMVSGFARV